MVKAVILSGGFGTRLRPLTCSRPKPLFPILNKTLLETQIMKLVKAGVSEVILAINYMAEVVQAVIGDGSKYGIKVTYSEEIEPLGTGGAVKNAEKFIDGDTFFQLNGDIVSTFDFAQLLKYHKDKKAELTLAGYIVEDPSRFGVMKLDGQNKVQQFVEKPKDVKKEDAFQLPINAGVNIFESSILNLIPPGKKISMEREIFPQLVDRGKVYCLPFSGLWFDVGLPKDFMLANKMLLEYYKSKGEDQTLVSPNCTIGKNTTVETPVAIESGVTIGSNCHIGPYTIIGKNAKIGDGVQISQSVLFENVRVGNFTSIKEAILGTGVSVGQWVKMEGDSEGMIILADHVYVQNKLTLLAWGTPLSRCPWEEVKENIFPNM
ncbi:MAG: nucleoside-diphosphate-sugar pyrophosphorylase [Promethearchaeota archaeon CR_4]|nr:MAG: nucleoside-diphosphate-sugar pyrophosphorylase [Candidatus Lokiarchaeota archaeon CR_4]